LVIVFLLTGSALAVAQNMPMPITIRAKAVPSADATESSGGRMSLIPPTALRLGKGRPVSMLLKSKGVGADKRKVRSNDPKHALGSSIMRC
jgi:hypothetical protein